MSVAHKPRRWLVAARVFVITFLATVITFAATLFVGVTIMALLSLVRGGQANMAEAYRHIALPAAVVACVIALVLGARNEIREYRRARAACLHQ